MSTARPVSAAAAALADVCCELGVEDRQAIVLLLAECLQVPGPAEVRYLRLGLLCELIYEADGAFVEWDAYEARRQSRPAEPWPAASTLHGHYGSWEAVLVAACQQGRRRGMLKPRGLPKEHCSVHDLSTEAILNAMWMCARQCGYGGRLSDIDSGVYDIFVKQRRWTSRLTGNRRLLVPNLKQVCDHYGGDFDTAKAAAQRQFGGVPEAEALARLEAWETRPMPELGVALVSDDEQALRMALDENLDGTDALRRANRLRGGKVLGPRSRERLSERLAVMRRADAVAELSG